MEYRRYRAPRRHGETLFDPPFDECPRIIETNHQVRKRLTALLGGLPLKSWMMAGRAELVRRASDYTRQYVDLPPIPMAAATQPILMSGHQPRLFHPGVWYKNFVLDRLARSTQSLAINLVIDNDLCGPAAIRVPTGPAMNPRVEPIDYDTTTSEIPFEERKILDRQRFDSFGTRVARELESRLPDPLIREWWPDVVSTADAEPNLGRCLARSRHQLEWRWGSRTLELPLSELCGTTSFRSFAAAVLRDLPRFREIYNRRLVEYRRLHHLRSHSHPVPELVESDGWLESPLWVWRDDQPRRRRLFWRPANGSSELADLQGWRVEIPLAAERDIEPTVAAFEDLARQGVRIRPRALLTTMYSRYLLSDLFVHGIGGGKYDQLTDAIASEWLALTPPRFLVVTATAQLPIPRPDVSDSEVMRTRGRLRDLRFNPDRYLRAQGVSHRLLDEKAQWLAADLSADQLSTRHQTLLRIQRELQTMVVDRRVELEMQLATQEEQARQTRLLGSREFAFCLFPSATLKSLLLDNAC